MEHPRPRARRAGLHRGLAWRNRDEFFTGREAIKDFLRRKWARELDYVLRKELWCYQGNRISVRFEYESHDGDGQWWRSHGNEHWEFDEDTGLMRRRDASINDYRIEASERRIATDSTAQRGRDALVGVGRVADSEAQVVGGEAGKEAHGRTAMPCSRRASAVAAPSGSPTSTKFAAPGWTMAPGPRSAQRRGRRAGERSRARWPAAWPGRMAMASMPASASALTDQAGRGARSLAAKGTGASR